MRVVVNPKTFGRATIGLARFGCKNRPFYHICVLPDKAIGRHYEGAIIEQLGTFDPMPNVNEEKLVSLNLERVKYWIGVRNARVGVSVLELLGLAGLLPVHPKTFIRAAHGRQMEQEKREAMQKEIADYEASQNEQKSSDEPV
uniref:Small ribosomal subunit protein bS16m n=1 Tax=Ditylenchus dipsaci TaxID=166011 RepID=A0A915DZV1_9BILA